MANHRRQILEGFFQSLQQEDTQNLSLITIQNIKIFIIIWKGQCSCSLNQSSAGHKSFSRWHGEEKRKNFKAEKATLCSLAENPNLLLGQLTKKALRRDKNCKHMKDKI